MKSQKTMSSKDRIKRQKFLNEIESLKKELELWKEYDLELKARGEELIRKIIEWEEEYESKRKISKSSKGKRNVQ